jgi:hypothetical protein
VDDRHELSRRNNARKETQEEQPCIVAYCTRQNGLAPIFHPAGLHLNGEVEQED